MRVQAELLQTVNLDLLNTAISPYGFVRKMVTFNRPEGGLFAWAQFIDASTASTVRCGAPVLVAAWIAVACSNLAGMVDTLLRVGSSCCTFSPVAGVQFVPPRPRHAPQVKASLGGQPIPRHLLGEHPTPPIMEMAFSTHLDLGVRTQSYCTR